MICVAPVIPSCRAHLNVPYGREDRANISQETGTMHMIYWLNDWIPAFPPEDGSVQRLVADAGMTIQMKDLG
jgi:hypothetical protein